MNPTKNRVWIQVLREGTRSCSTSDTRRVDLLQTREMKWESCFCWVFLFQVLWDILRESSQESLDDL